MAKSEPSKFIPYHRLVIATPHLEWDIPIDIEISDIRIRFDRLVTGIDTTPVEQVQTGNHIVIRSQRESESEPGVDSGMFAYREKNIEIICPGSTPEIAELRCHSVLGFIAFCYGDNAHGETVFSERYLGDPDGEYIEVAASSHGDVATPLDQQANRILHPGLSRLAHSDSSLDSVGMALRWYEHALRQESFIDRIVSNFIGVERLVRDWAPKHNVESNLAELGKDSEFIAFLMKYSKTGDNGAVENLAHDLTRPSIAECFEAYAREYRLDAQWKAVFDRMRKLRNATAHSKVKPVTAEDALDSQSLLRTMLKRELSIGGILPSEVFPGRLQNTISWTNENGWVRAGDVDWLGRFENVRREWIQAGSQGHITLHSSEPEV